MCEGETTNAGSIAYFPACIRKCHMRRGPRGLLGLRSCKYVFYDVVGKSPRTSLTSFSTSSWPSRAIIKKS